MREVAPRAVCSGHTEGEPDRMDACLNLPLVPMINLGRLVSEDCAKPALEKLHRACKDWGLFQALNIMTIVHLIKQEVSTKLIEKVKKGTEELLNMPMEEKKKLWQRDGEADGFGQAFVLSEDQKLDWADICALADATLVEFERVTF
ncbi:protein SRG1-like [Rhodamnia argentea]|uniref:Protein SRG1-like n=1 Tax=Rhodamnia argentea TaxID=178133 RepID=A0ABM3H4P0_9MYRT|nr:protein SRG1-like [Rhodamnia argentea]